MSRAYDQWDHTVPGWFPFSILALIGAFVLIMYLLALS